MGTCTSAPGHDDSSAVQPMSPRRRFSDVAPRAAGAGGDAAGGTAAHKRHNRSRDMEGSVILMEPPVIGAIATPLHKPATAPPAATSAGGAAAKYAAPSKAAPADEVRKPSISSVTRSELVRNGTASALMPSVRESHPHHAGGGGAHSQMHSAHNSRPSSATPHERPALVASATNGGSSTAPPSQPHQSSDLLVVAAAAAAAATATAALQAKKDRKAQRALRREEKAARQIANKDGPSSSSTATGGGAVYATSSTAATAASSSDAAAASAAQSEVEGEEDAAAAVGEEEELVRPEGLRRQLSLEDEADERTARSLRNFEAERVLTQTALHICTFFPNREHAHSASTAVTGSAHPGSSPHESRSPSESPRPGSNTHHGRPARGMHSGTSTPGSVQSGAISPQNGMFVSAGGSVAAAAAAALTASHTPGGSSTPQPMVSAPYVNPDILDDSAVIFTPTGKRTALALLMTGNNSARTSPRGPQGLKPSVSLPFGFPTLGAAQGQVSFSKTVPNSPRSLSPVHAPAKHAAHGPSSHHHHHAASASAADATAAVPERASSASRLLAVPGGSMLAPPTSTTPGGSSSTARLSRATIQSRLAPKRAGTLTVAQQQEATAAAAGYTRSQSGALQSYQPPQQPYSRSVQTSPKHSRSSTGLSHGGHGHGGGHHAAAALHIGVPRNFPVLHGSDPPSPVGPGENGLAAASATASIAAGVWSTATGEELFDRRPAAHRRTNTGGAASVGNSGSTTPNPSAPPSAVGPSASLLRFQARMRSANHARTGAPDLEADALVSHPRLNTTAAALASGEGEVQEQNSAGPYLPRGGRRNSRG